MPAHSPSLDPEVRKAIKADYAGMRSKAKRMPNGLYFNWNQVSALARSDAWKRRREYEARWVDGGVAFMGAFGDLLTNQAANDTAADFVRGKIRETVRDPKIAEDEWVSHARTVAGTSFRSTCSSWYVGANVPGKPLVFMPLTKSSTQPAPLPAGPSSHT